MYHRYLGCHDRFKRYESTHAPKKTRWPHINRYCVFAA